ncbi:protein tyrosine phosphatase family protein [Sphingobium subterraneum]|uniref:Uncharacterized protein (TIGR01244 family) n=1 Tax=Sphingobium subterraneum TaxID=627688 RepID=A0A841J0P3_9SPHN|nr:protein tyrosine phosphatase family protein [Sphingobium subterraneum]MBB6124769.1 uncharacterized protein (TIGR01244 family) [Sphingobium subterraneum]
MLNTLRTVVRFWLSRLERCTGRSLLPARVEAITNYHRIDDRLATGGQPNVAQIDAIAKAGYRTVINLAPSSSPNALPDEQALIEAAGMAYIHIPVVWADPTQADFDRFCTVMAEHSGERVFVHCAANMRVSAFIYRYRRDVLREVDAIARADLHRLWQPTGVWAEFIALRGSSQ